MRKVKILSYDLKSNKLHINDLTLDELKGRIRQYDKSNIWWELADTHSAAVQLRDKIYKEQRDFFYAITEYNREIKELNRIINSSNSTEEDVNMAQREKMKIIKKRQQLIRENRYNT